jgi:hypothetical protein
VMKESTTLDVREPLLKVGRIELPVVKANMETTVYQRL